MRFMSGDRGTAAHCAGLPGQQAAQDRLRPSPGRGREAAPQGD
jgi:hypothetical protein